MTGFKIYNGTKQAFIDSGKASSNTDAIVFITGGTEGDKSSCIYTQGSYFGSITELMKAINYVKGISVGGQSYNVAAGGGYVAFGAADPSTVVVNAGQNGVEIGLTSAFVTKVNGTANALGNTSDTANSQGSAFARIANLAALVSDLTGGSTDSIEGQINSAIENLKEEILGPIDEGDFLTIADANDEILALTSRIDNLKGSGSGGELVQVSVSTSKGEVNSVTVNEDELDKSLAAKADLENGKILTSQLPDYILGQVMYGGVIYPDGTITSTDMFKDRYGVINVVTSNDASKYEGVYFIVGSELLNSTVIGVTKVSSGDWIISTGSSWQKIDNTDAVTSVAGLIGVIGADELAAKLIDTNNTTPLATKSDVTGVKVSASGDNYVSASVDTNGRVITVAATDTVKTAVTQASTAYQKPSTGIPTSDLKDGTKLTNAIQGINNSTYITATVDSNKKITATAKVEGIDSTTTGLVTNASVKTYVDSMWEWEIISDED